jgi:hypothetical protein
MALENYHPLYFLCKRHHEQCKHELFQFMRVEDLPTFRLVHIELGCRWVTSA